MQYAKILAVLLVFFFAISHCKGQLIDSTHMTNKPDTTRLQLSWQKAHKNQHPIINPYIVPGFMIAYGFTAIKSNGLKNLNTEIKEDVYLEHPHNNVHIDNFLQFAPAAMVFGLDVFGLKAKHNFRDRSMLFLISNIFTNVSVSSIKNFSHQLRPDSSAYNSFPSGHTAEAFANAEFLRQEYKDISPWYGVAGYAIAVTTGYLRLYNNKHWLSDVVAGAGFGIISTKLAYWLYPKIQHKLFKNKSTAAIIMPFYQNKVGGFSMAYNFH
jgi:PAP2 superfamily